jgi:hypothetical protein
MLFRLYGPRGTGYREKLGEPTLRRANFSILHLALALRIETFISAFVGRVAATASQRRSI